MDLFFEPTKGKPFTIEVGYFDTILEIKEKIQKHHGVPISKQTLILNGQVLQDELNVHFSHILDRSRVQLIVTSEHEKPQIKIEHSSPTKNIHLLLKMPTSKLGIALEMHVTDTIRKVKEKVRDLEGVPVNRLVVHANAKEFQDHRTLNDCELVDHSEIDVSLKPGPTTSSGSSGNATGSKKLHIMVLTTCGTKRIPVEVNAKDNVEELRKELENLIQKFNFQLPQEGYFFIYKQNVMEDDRSFRWHRVGQGDTIEIFSGSVTGGS